MRKYLHTFLVLSFLACATGSITFGATIVPVAGSGSFTAQVFMPGDLGSILAIDVRSTAFVEVFNPASLGFVQTGDFGAAPPNSVILGLDGISEFIVLTFDTAGAVQSALLDTLTVNATASPGSSITNPALAAMLGSLVGSFSLDPASITGNTDTGFILTYNLTSLIGGASDVPEPATFALLGCGLLMVAAIRKRARAR